MDRKSIAVLIVCFILLILVGPLVQKIYPPIPVPEQTNRVHGARSPEALPGATNAPAATDRPPTISAAPTTPVERWHPPQQPEQRLELDTPEARYVFTSHGGGLELVELKDYPAEIHCRGSKSTNDTAFATLNAHARVPALALFGGAALQDSLPYTLERTAAGVRAEKALTNGLRIVKEFVPATNHQLILTLRIRNATNTSITLPETELTVGTAAPLEPKEQPRYLGVQYFDGKSSHFINAGWFANHMMGCGCLPGTPRSEFRSPGMSNIVWASVPNRFFTMIAAPENPGYQLLARQVKLDWPELAAQRGQRDRGYEAALLYPSTTVPAGGELVYKVVLFAGPKEYNTLAKLGKSQDLAMNFRSIFGWFAKALLLSMNALHGVGLPYGIAIIVITIIIKTLFWPLTQASTRSMKRMQALQPQMKAIQEKYKDDPRKMNAKLMAFMKENRVSPLGGCLPMLLQIPVFIGFYQMLQSAIELRGASFLWACDLSQPDTIATVFGFPINPLPLIMGASQLWQTRMTPPSPGMDPMQQKMMQYMPVIFIFILYNFPAGLALYWTVQNLLTILQMKLTKNLPDTPKPGAPGAPSGPAPAPAKVVKPVTSARRRSNKRRS
jgi:YidC/Oxa1 family membrane protein insertase